MSNITRVAVALTKKCHPGPHPRRHRQGDHKQSAQQLLRSLVNEIVVDVDEQAREITLVIHWRGGQHSLLRVPKPESCEHGCRTANEPAELIRSMVGRWLQPARTLCDRLLTFGRLGLSD